MITATWDQTDMNRGLAGLVKVTRLNAKVVTRIEMGRLVTTLVRVSPPSEFSITKDKAQLERRIERDINSKFEGLSDRQLSFAEGKGKLSKSGLWLTGATSRFLYATAKADFKTKKSMEGLATMRWRITKSRRLSLPFFHPRRRQRVLLSKTITVGKNKLKQIVKYAQRGVGRLKAGWLPIISLARVPLSGGTIPPWVRRHAIGAKGTFADESDSDNPSITIINRARGIGQKQIDGLVRLALKIRVKAMAKNVLMFASGKKPVSSYIGSQIIKAA